jgi:hypothetical protein
MKMKFATLATIVMAVIISALSGQSIPRPTSTPLPPNNLTTRGLTHEKVVTDLYRGDFLDISFNREDTPFEALFEGYLKAYAKQCAKSLPPDRVEMTTTECVASYHTVNRYGGRVGPDICTRSEQQGTGLWADPTLYDAKLKLDSLMAGNLLHETFRIVAQGNPSGAAMNMLDVIQTYEADMSSLLRLNSCTSPAVKRFEQNVTLFALGKQPVRLLAPGGSSLTAQTAAPAMLSVNQNYAKLVNDLISEQSKTWIMNRYVGGSASNVSITARDASGRPSKLVAQYQFNSKDRGSVTLEFSDGLPSCLYFFDMPAVCKSSDRRVVAAFASGSYSK